MKQAKIADLPSLGPVSAHWLREIGVESRSDLQAMGAVAAYSLIKAQHSPASLNLLYALHGALTNQKWNDLSQTEKAQLKESADSFRFGD